MPKYGLDPGPRLNLTGPVVERVMPTGDRAMISPEAAQRQTRPRAMRPAIRRRMNDDVINQTVDFRPTPMRIRSRRP